ncbi:MAG TPA: DNA replication protein DnaD, partial [Lachnospiraceae bacterium]|nr:DNA replication protein DnaD [Lachnospiraceae bacterium]
ETDIIRALNYWSKEGLVTLNKDQDGHITEIILLEAKGTEQEPLSEALPANNSQRVAEEIKYGNSDFSSESAATVAPEPKQIIERPTYTEAQIAELTNTDEIKWLMNIIEIYLERLLTPTDVQLICYLYETLNFSAELIMHLYDYCVSKNKRNASYIEAVALAWAEQGVDSVEKAEASSAKYNTTYQAISKAFGLNRQPGAIEKQYIDKWTQKYGLDVNIIVEACNRALLRTGKPDFKYTDGIIENWHKHNVKTRADIDALDASHSQRSKQYAQNVQKQNQPKPNPKNQFNNFQQRDYSKEYISDLEQRLLNK